MKLQRPLRLGKEAACSALLKRPPDPPPPLCPLFSDGLALSSLTSLFLPPLSTTTTIRLARSTFPSTFLPSCSFPPPSPSSQLAGIHLSPPFSPASLAFRPSASLALVRRRVRRHVDEPPLPSSLPRPHHSTSLTPSLNMDDSMTHSLSTVCRHLRVLRHDAPPSSSSPLVDRSAACRSLPASSSQTPSRTPITSTTMTSPSMVPPATFSSISHLRRPLTPTILTPPPSLLLTTRVGCRRLWPRRPPASRPRPGSRRPHTMRRALPSSPMMMMPPPASSVGGRSLSVFRTLASTLSPSATDSTTRASSFPPRTTGTPTRASSGET